ncbi:hypothetical protein KKG46_00575 [Patescibacteria group bacterium]|nr:hypothetical protein [Patescibacteria group bacterium]
MNKIKEHIIIFSSKLTPLGEVICDQGTYGNVILNQAGEIELGHNFADWRVTGLPTLVPQTAMGKKATLIVAERIQIHSPLFKAALLSWFDLHGYQYLAFNNQSVKIWHLIDQLPLRSQEKYLLSLGIRDLKQSEVNSWIVSLEKIHQNVLQ